VLRREARGVPLLFHAEREPDAHELQGLVEQVAVCVGRTLEQCGQIECEVENAWLAAADSEAGPLEEAADELGERLLLEPRRVRVHAGLGATCAA
jgi:hypothetical protein